MYTVLGGCLQRLCGGGVHSGARLHLRDARYIRSRVEASQDLSAKVCNFPTHLDKCHLARWQQSVLQSNADEPASGL